MRRGAGEAGEKTHEEAWEKGVGRVFQAGRPLQEFRLPPPAGPAAWYTPSDNGNSINLSWTPSVSSGATEQRVYRSTTTGGPYNLVNTIPNNTTSTYTDSTGLTNGTTYYYVIRAFGGGQESGNSNEANMAPADNIAPNAQTGLSAADVAGDNGGAIALNWTVSSSGDVTQQRLYRGTTLGGPYPTLVTTIPNNTTSNPYKLKRYCSVLYLQDYTAHLWLLNGKPSVQWLRWIQKESMRGLLNYRCLKGYQLLSDR